MAVDRYLMAYVRDVRRVGNQLGHPPNTSEYEQHGNYARSTISQKLESWDDGLQLAGLDPSEKLDRRDGGPGSEPLPDDVLLEDLRAGAAVLGRPPSQREMDRFGNHGARTYIRHFGSWDSALEAAGLDPDDPDRGHVHMTRAGGQA